MQINLNSEWQTILSDEIQKSYFQDLINSVENEYAEHTCFPPQELIFSAFNNCSFQDLKVVIIGQDPYHGEGEANGLCFSVYESEKVKVPQSLNNIFIDIKADLGKPISQDANLERWAKQGVLLLNASLTVRENKANSHKNLGWKKFTDAVIEKISEEKKNVVFLLWGKFAQKKGLKLIIEKNIAY